MRQDESLNLIANMKKKIFLRFLLVPVFLHCISVLLPAQKIKRNMLQVKYSLDYFKGYEPSLFAGLFYPDISYKRFFKNKQRFVEFEFNSLDIGYTRKTINISDIRKVRFRYHHILESKIGSYLIVTPRLSFLLKGGVAYRFGEESRIMGLRYYPGTNILFEFRTATYRYRDFGVVASFEFLYRYGERGYLTLEAGGKRFLIRKITTKQQFYASLGVGYAF